MSCKVIDAVSKFVPRSNIVATTNCGMAPMRRDIAEAKLMALGAGAKLARQRIGVMSFRGARYSKQPGIVEIPDVNSGSALSRIRNDIL